MFADGEPDGLRVAVGGEDFFIKLLAASLYHRFDLLDMAGFDGVGNVQVVFHVPAQVFLFLLGEGESDAGFGFKLGLAWALQREADRILPVGRAVLAYAECGA